MYRVGVSFLPLGTICCYDWAVISNSFYANSPSCPRNVSPQIIHTSANLQVCKMSCPRIGKSVNHLSTNWHVCKKSSYQLVWAALSNVTQTNCILSYILKLFLLHKWANDSGHYMMSPSSDLASACMKTKGNKICENSPLIVDMVMLLHSMPWQRGQETIILYRCLFYSCCLKQSYPAALTLHYLQVQH